MGKSFGRVSTAIASFLFLITPSLPATPKNPGPADPSGRVAMVRDAMLRTYLHGINDDLARQVLAEGDIPALFDLLADPLFPRRDNVVAFLAHRAGNSATAHLVAFLNAPPADLSIPEEDRAILGAPQALGHIASRGHGEALEILLAMTEDGSDGGPLAWAAEHASEPMSLRGDLMEMALRGLAFSRSPRARARLQEVARGFTRPDGGGRDLSRPAQDSLSLLDTMEVQGGMGGQAPGGAPWRLDGASASAPSSASGGGIAVTGPVAEIADTQGRSHLSSLTYANHVAVPSPMDDSRLDAVLNDGSRRTARSDFSGDVACCNVFNRSGTANLFGTAGDGLDIIDNSTELNAVLFNSTARVHVVRTINWCSSPGSNIIGCAWVGGNGMSLVRLSTASSEGILWIHEYGHNTQLGHATDGRAIMYGILNGGNNGVSSAECNSYHSPSGATGLSPVDIGVCGDADADDVADPADNCPAQANFLQEDFDADHEGDLCDLDDDNDGVDDGADCSSRNNQAWAQPIEALNLDATTGGVGTLLTWNAPTLPGGPAAAIRYDTIQSDMATDFVTPGFCVESSAGPDTSASTGVAGPPPWITEGNLINARYAVSVSIAGDIDGDGDSELVVGASQFANGQDQEGRLFVYQGTAFGPGTISETRELDVDLARLGSSVAGAGDVDNDGFADVIAGAPNYDNGLSFGGGAFLWRGSASGLEPAFAWSAFSDIFGASFGAAVSPAGDVNNDSFDDVLIGAPTYDNGFFNEGRAFLFLGSASGLEASPSWSAIGGQVNARFGAAVAAAGDVNNDGFDDVIVGAPQHDNGVTDEGRVYLFLGSASGLSATPAAILEVNVATAGFGGSLSGTGDVDGDGFDDILVGAPGWDNGQNNEGGAFFYRGGASGLLPGPAWSVEGDQIDAALGSSVRGVGDVSFDGRPDLLVGASGYDGDLVNEGRVQLFLGSPIGPRRNPDRIVEGDQAGAALGASLGGGLDVNRDGIADMVAGANLFDGPLVDEGKAIWMPGSRAILPQLNKVFFYLVRPENACGAGPAGFGPTGSPITALVCP